MPQIADYLRLVRIKNVILTALAVLVGGWIAVPGRFSFFLYVGAASAALIAAGANAYNDACDIEPDRINHPNRPLVTGSISEKTAILFSLLVTVIGWLMGCLLLGWLFTIPIAIALLLLAYNRELKRKPWFGNIVVAFCGAMAPVFGAWIAGDVKLGAAPGFLTLLTFLLRELAKDVEDLPGDRIAGYKTAPMTDSFFVFKVRFWLLSLLLAIGILQVIGDKDFYGFYFEMIAILTLVLLFTIIAMSITWGSNDITRSRRISLLCKGILAIGMAMLVVGRIGV